MSRARLRVLKELRGGRRTGSELARALDMNKSTVHGYLQDLVEDGLLRRHSDEERLWVYYSLSDVGRSIVDRDRLVFVVDLGTIAAAAGAAAMGLHRFLDPPEPTGGGGILAEPPGGGAEGLPWATIAYVALLGLVVLGVVLHLHLRRRTVGGPSGGGAT